MARKKAPTALDKRRKRERREKRPWPLTAVTLLLLGQMLMMLAVSVLHPFAGDDLAFRLESFQATINAMLQTLTLTLTFVVIAFAAFVASIGTIRRGNSAWMAAMLVQGLSLAVALVLYFGARPVYTYPMMLYAVVIVVYLILPSVQAAFVPVGERK